ncbi:hypothetical protein KCU65_g7906, partial [Aureobasidium melanogenum]
MVAAADEELVTLELVLVIVNKVLLRTEEFDNVEAVEEIEDIVPELELLVPDVLRLTLLLLEDDGPVLLADGLKLDEDEVVAWVRLLEVEEDLDDNAEVEIEVDE